MLACGWAAIARKACVMEAVVLSPSARNSAGVDGLTPCCSISIIDPETSAVDVVLHCALRTVAYIACAIVRAHKCTRVHSGT